MGKSTLRLLLVTSIAFAASNSVSAPPPEGKGKNTVPEIVAPRWVDANGAFLGLYVPSARTYYSDGTVVCGEGCNEYDQSANLMIQLPDETAARILVIKWGGIWNTQDMYYTDSRCRAEYGQVYVRGGPQAWTTGYGLAADGINAYRADMSVPPADIRYHSTRRPGGQCIPHGTYYNALGVYPVEQVFSIEGFVAPFRVSIVK